MFDILKEMAADVADAVTLKGHMTAKFKSTTGVLVHSSKIPAALSEARAKHRQSMQPGSFRPGSIFDTAEVECIPQLENALHVTAA